MFSMISINIETKLKEMILSSKSQRYVRHVHSKIYRQTFFVKFNYSSDMKKDILFQILLFSANCMKNFESMWKILILGV